MLLFTPLTVEELRRMGSQYDVVHMLGLMCDGQIIKPPVCPICGELLYVDFVEGIPDISQCFKCGEIRRVFYSDRYTLRKEWKTLYGESKNND